MRRTRSSLFLSSVAAALLFASASVAAEVSDVLEVRRPKGGEYFGLYLLDKKVGYVFTDVAPLPGNPSRVKAVNEIFFRAKVGQNVSERRHVETRIYESKPNGRLLSFKVEAKGDGGDQTLEGTATPTGLTVLVKRPGQPNQVRNLPASREVVEDADQVRVALHRNREVRGTITDGQDLKSYGVRTTVSAPEERLIGGVKVKLSKAVTISDKEQVPVTTFVSADGKVVEIQFPGALSARAEAEEVAKRLDHVEVFGLTRVVLPESLGPRARQIPNAFTFVLSGLPEQFRKDSYRQKFKPLPNGTVVVTLSAAAPQAAHAKKGPKLPLKDPEGGANLKSDLMVESDHPEIRALAKKLVGNEKDPYAAATKIVGWVGANLKKEYGASADRATDVLRQLRGDCTEHSLLAVSLLRAAGIPAKRKDGLVYLEDDGVPALYWHQWVEAWVGEWTQLDPTFNQPVADATHFAVGEEGNAAITPLIGTLRVVEVR